MGYTAPITTKNATYVVSLEHHLSSDYSAFELQKFDFAVIEQAMEGGEGAAGAAKRIKELQKAANCDILVLDPSSQNILMPFETAKHIFGGVADYLGIVLLVKRARIPKYNKPTRRRFLGAAVSIIAGSRMLGAPGPFEHVAAGIPLTFRGKFGRPREALAKITAYLGKAYSPLMLDARNAIIAEKLDSLIVPMLEKKLGRKPHIAIQIGAAHAGIVEYLKNPGRRREAIFRLREKISEGLVREHLDKAYRVRWDAKAKDLHFEELKTPITPLMERKPEKPKKLSRWQFFARFRKHT